MLLAMTSARINIHTAADEAVSCVPFSVCPQCYSICAGISCLTLRSAFTSLTCTLVPRFPACSSTHKLTCVRTNQQHFGKNDYQWKMNNSSWHLIAFMKSLGLKCSLFTGTGSPSNLPLSHRGAVMSSVIRPELERRPAISKTAHMCFCSPGKL